MSNTAVFGVYKDTPALSAGLESLRNSGFRNTDISVLLPENAGTKDFVHQRDTKAPEGATTGAATGAVVGGVLGWIAGIGALAIPGIGPLIAAGPIVAMLAGAGAVGAAGGIVGTLVGLGIPEYEAKRFEGRVRTGGTLLSVHCDNSGWVKKRRGYWKTPAPKTSASSSEAKADYAASERPGSRN
jgi:hypothetical protein